MSAIETSGLTKDYFVGFWRKRPWRALDGLSLRVERGEVFGFLGHNGAGKTTTLKLLTGLIFPTSGSAAILGRPLGRPETFRHLGYLPENPYFYDYLTAQELLEYFGSFFPLSASERARRCQVVLEQTGLLEFRDRALRKFSKGMLQRLGIAQAVLHNPEVVLLDEPMSGLDPMGRRDVRKLIAQLKAEGKTVFFSTHILSDAEALCDRVAVVNRGRLVGVGHISELLKSKSGREAVVELTEGAPAEIQARLRSLADQVSVSGQQFRLEIREENLRPFLELCARDGVRLVSLHAMLLSLEDYFAQISGEPPSPEPVISGARP